MKNLNTLPKEKRFTVTCRIENSFLIGKIENSTSSRIIFSIMAIFHICNSCLVRQWWHKWPVCWPSVSSHTRSCKAACPVWGTSCLPSDCWHTHSTWSRRTGRASSAPPGRPAAPWGVWGGDRWRRSCRAGPANTPDSGAFLNCIMLWNWNFLECSIEMRIAPTNRDEAIRQQPMRGLEFWWVSQ